VLLTISTTYQPATDLGYLLHKHPAQIQHFEIPYGVAHVFYTQANQECCTANLLLDIDPVALVRNRRGPGHFTLEQYVNDRPYVASSFLSVALSRVFGTAMNGKSKDRPELAATAIPLRAQISALPCRDGEPLLHRLFEPLGYNITVENYLLDQQFPDWGSSTFFTVSLEASCRLADLLTHLYVLVPVLDDEKHYWVGDDEVQKLLARGEGWLALHPERNLIARRYLRYKPNLLRDALAQLLEADQADPDTAEVAHTEIGEFGKRKMMVKSRDEHVDRFSRDCFHNLRDLARLPNAWGIKTIGASFGVRRESVECRAQRIGITDQPCFATAG